MPGYFIIAEAPPFPQSYAAFLYLTLERIYCTLMGQTTRSSAQPASAVGDTGYIVAEHQIGKPYTRVADDIQSFLEWNIIRETSMSRRVDGGKQHRTKLLRDMAELTEVIRQTLESEAKVKKQIAASTYCMDKVIQLAKKREEADEADKAAIRYQECQQLFLTQTTGVKLREAVRELKALEAKGIELCNKVVKGAQTVEELLRCSTARRLNGLGLPSDANMTAATGQGAQQLETLIKDVAALDQALNHLDVIQGEVKRLVETSKADLTTILQQGTRNHIAVQGQPESEQLRIAANNVGALELAFSKLNDAQIIGATLADKVIKQIAATKSAMVATESGGSKKIAVPLETVSLLRKAAEGLLDVRLNAVLLDDSVKEFAVSAHSFLAAAREPTASQLRASRRGGLEMDLSDM